MKNICLQALLGLAFFIPSYSFAFRFSPMVVEFSPTGAKSTQVLVIENPGDEKLPVQIEVFARSTDAKGEEARTKTEDFVVFPEQVVLLPKEKRNVRVTYSGEIKDGKEKAFRIVASQLPVDFRDKNSASKKPKVNLKFLLQYVASAYVTPEGASSKVVTRDIKKTSAKKLAVTFANEGTAHQVLIFKSFKVTAGKEIVLEQTTNKTLESTNLLAGDKKTIEFETTKDIPMGELKAELVLKDLEN